LGKTGLKESASAAKSAKIAKETPKGAVALAKNIGTSVAMIEQ
jgi:hypothetical protein